MQGRYSSAMRHAFLGLAVAAGLSASAEEPFELKWKLAKGDRFAIEISLDAATEMRDEDGTYETTKTFRLSGVLEVTEAGDDGAKVELRIGRTTGKMRSKESGDVEDTPLNTEASDWTEAGKGQLTKRGNCEFDFKPFMTDKPAAAAVIEALNALFPELPETTPKLKEPWPGRDTANGETLQLTALSRKSATIEGKFANEQKRPAQGGQKAQTSAMKGTIKCEFDVAGGAVTTSEAQMTAETRVEGRGKPDTTQSWRRTVVVKRLPAEKK